MAAALLAAAFIAAVFVWPGSQAKAAIAALTVNHGCFLPNGEARIAAVGDSVTEGHRFPALNVGANDSYADMASCQSGLPIANLGAAGSTSDKLLAHVDIALTSAPETVLVLAGTNDVFLKHDPDMTVRNIAAIHAKLAEAGVDEVFGLLPPSNHDPKMVMVVNEKLRVWAAAEHVTIVDYWTPLADADGTYKDGFDREGDGVHPSPSAAKLMAAEAVKALSRL